MFDLNRRGAQLLSTLNVNNKSEIMPFAFTSNVNDWDCAHHFSAWKKKCREPQGILHTFKWLCVFFLSVLVSFHDRICQFPRRVEEIENKLASTTWKKLLFRLLNSHVTILHDSIDVFQFVCSLIIRNWKSTETSLSFDYQGNRATDFRYH